VLKGSHRAIDRVPATTNRQYALVSPGISPMQNHIIVMPIQIVEVQRPPYPGLAGAREHKI
jgi:hypothetical protein